MTFKYCSGINFCDIDIFRQHVTLAFYANNDGSAKIYPVTVNDTHREKLFYTPEFYSQFSTRMAASDLFICLHNQLSSIHLLSRVKEYRSSNINEVVRSVLNVLLLCCCCCCCCFVFVCFFLFTIRFHKYKKSTKH